MISLPLSAASCTRDEENAMGLRSIPGWMDVGKVASIDAAVDDIVREHCVAIGLAVESGSRAQGLSLARQ
jgi:hypothetical protein